MDKYTLYLAWYGAILSTIVFLWTLFRDIISIRRDRPQLKVIMGRGSSSGLTALTATNAGKKPIIIDLVGVTYTDGSTREWGLGPSCSVELTEGKPYTATLDIPPEDQARILYAWARDAMGKNYRSRKKPLLSTR